MPNEVREMVRECPRHRPAVVGGEHQRSRWDRKRRGRIGCRLIEAALVLASVTLLACARPHVITA